MSLQLTHHAIMRFIDRFRPGLSKEQADAELRDITLSATPTRRRTLTGDAWLYVALTSLGEKIALAVRDDTVITVLPEDKKIDLSPTQEHMDESEATHAACRAMLEATAEIDAINAQKRQEARRELFQRSSAIRLIADFRAGKQRVGAAALERAYNRLEMCADDPLPKS